MHLESKDILQINATIIVGVLILLSVTSIPELTKAASYAQDPSVAGNPKTVASLVILAFSVSSLIELIKILIQTMNERELGRRGEKISKYLSIGFMILGFMGLALFGMFLRVGIQNS